MWAAVSPGGSVARANQLTNGGFDTGDFTPWTATGSVALTNNDTTTSGSFAALFNSGGSTPNGGLSQTFSTVVGQRYALSFDYHTVAAGATTIAEYTVPTGSSNPYFITSGPDGNL